MIGDIWLSGETIYIDLNGEKKLGIIGIYKESPIPNILTGDITDYASVHGYDKIMVGNLITILKGLDLI